MGLHPCGEKGFLTGSAGRELRCLLPDAGVRESQESDLPHHVCRRRTSEEVTHYRAPVVNTECQQMADTAVVGPSPQVVSPRDERGTPADAVKAKVRLNDIASGAGLRTALSRTVAQPRWREGQRMSRAVPFAYAAFGS